MIIDGVKVTADAEFSAEELKYYVELVKSKFKDDKILTLTVSLEADGRARLDYTRQGTRFERIRRITGRQ